MGVCSRMAGRHVTGTSNGRNGVNVSHRAV